MTTDQIILFTLFAAVFGMLLWGRFRYDLVAFAALMVAVVLGVVDSKDAFAGFGHPATLVVALVLVVSAGLTRSGAVLLITRTLVDASRSLGGHITLMGVIGGVLSAFMNNVAALALLMPVDIQTARKAGRSPGLSLMPLSFATILGGMATLIGTPPNIIIASIRQESLGEPFRMFDFAPVGGIAAAAGLAFVALIGWRFIPQRENNVLGPEDLSPYLAELTIPEGNAQIGKRLAELQDAAEKADVAMLGVIRDGKRRYGQSRNLPLRAGDALVLEATPDALDEFRSTLDLHVADADREDRLRADGEGVEIIEVVVSTDASSRLEVCSMILRSVTLSSPCCHSSMHFIARLGQNDPPFASSRISLEISLTASRPVRSCSMISGLIRPEVSKTPIPASRFEVEAMFMRVIAWSVLMPMSIPKIARELIQSIVAATSGTSGSDVPARAASRIWSMNASIDWLISGRQSSKDRVVRPGRMFFLASFHSSPEVQGSPSPTIRRRIGGRRRPGSLRIFIARRPSRRMWPRPTSWSIVTRRRPRLRSLSCSMTSIGDWSSW